MKITIIGTGYVGLVTGTCFAEVGHQVICVDNNEEKVRLLQSGGIPIYEPGLEELVKKNVAEGRLSFTDSTPEGVRNSDVIFIAVPTPPQPDGSVDLSFIERVARDIAGAMDGYKIVVDKSTVPVNTGDKVACPAPPPATPALAPGTPAICTELPSMTGFSSTATREQCGSASRKAGRASVNFFWISPPRSCSATSA